MNMTVIIATLIGFFSICAYIANWLGKRKVRGEIPVQARVTDSQSSEWASASRKNISGKSYVVQTTFDFPLKGALSHTRHFGTRIDAGKWAERFIVGSWHPVLQHPFSPGEVFLEEELSSNPPTALAIGILAFMIAGIAARFG